MADDALALDRGADHEAWDIGQEQERDVECVAGPDEPRALVRGIDEQDAALDLRLVGHDPDDVAVEPSVADDDLLGPAGVDLQERALVEQRLDQLEHVERLVLVERDDVPDRAVGGRSARRGVGRVLDVAGGEVAQVTLGELDSLLVG